MFKAMLAALVLGIGIWLSAEPIYQWVDEKGITHYSDAPLPEAVQVERKLPPAVQLESPTLPPPFKEPEKIEYEVTLTQPSDNSTIRSYQGNMVVLAEITPTPPKPYRMQLWVDGRMIKELESQAGLQVQDLSHGKHTILLKFISDKGETLAESKATTVFMVRGATQNADKKPTN